MTRRGRETGHFAVSGEKKKKQKISLWFFPLVLFSLGNFFVSLWENFDLEKICKLRIEE
jgi:cytochrome c-type biogenesis protein CcmH/NrfF